MTYYENLPGVKVTVNDGGLIIPEAGGSESMLIIAPSLMKDAPAEPTLVRSSLELTTYGFGDFYVNGEINPIACEWKVAVDNGCKSIYLCALKEISEERAKELEEAAVEKMTERGFSILKAQSKVSGVLTGHTEKARKNRLFVAFHDLLMGALVDFEVDHIVVKGVTIEDEVEEMHPAFFPDIDEIDSFPHINGFVISSHVLESAYLSYPIEIKVGESDKLALDLADGKQEITLKPAVYDGREKTIMDLARDLEEALLGHETPIKARVRENMNRISIYLAEEAKINEESTTVAIDLPKETVWQKTSFGTIVHGSFAQTIADYCRIKTLMQSPVIGYIGTKSPSDVKAATIRQHVKDLLTIDTEVSPYLQVVASEIGITLPVSNQMYYTNGSTAYAAMISGLRPESAPTNKVFQGVKAPRFQYSTRQLSQLTANKMVTFRVKNGNQLVVTDAMTTAPSITIANVVRDSDYARLSTLRITQLAIQVVREACEPFIGEANGIPQYSSLQTAVRSALETIREAGAISGYDFRVKAATSRLDKAIITLSIIPAFELRRVDVDVNLAPPTDLLMSSSDEEAVEAYYRYLV